MFKVITTKLSIVNHKKYATAVCAVAFFISAFAIADDKTAIESFSVVGQKDNLPTRPGSAHILDEKDLKKMQYDDINRILRSVPGVNIQEEDAFGLRPNIGFRGVHPHRSKKITIMEDGVLIGPAPYSAPAAYYFPMMDKIGSVEVFKGVPSTQFGPNSIGGAINLLSKINDQGVEADVSYGSFNYQKYDLSVGAHVFGDLSIDLTRISHDGFKNLPRDQETGFVKHNVMVRWDKVFFPMDQNLTFKLNWSDEDSHETYLGLTKDDFNQDPFQRYSGSQDDEMKWRHRQAFVSYALTPAEGHRVRTTVYHHEFDRSWFKFNGFFDKTVDAYQVLKNPYLAANNHFYRVLKGEVDSSLTGNRDLLRQTDNTRSYYSQGAQLKWDYNLGGFAWDHNFSFSYRFHRDQIDRDHVSTFYSMQNNDLVLSSQAAEIETQNVSSAEASTASLMYETVWEKLYLQGVARFEEINYEELDEPTQVQSKTADHVFAPGVGLFYQFFDQGGVLAGINKGFTPVGPGQAPNIHPEESINYELGFRYNGNVGVELIGFYSDYTNLLGTCTLSSGCNVSNIDQRFNGGEAEISGVELLLSKDIKQGAWTFPIRLNGTYTKAQFNSSFSTTLNDWGVGQVNVGDPIPYIPEYQGNLGLGAQWKAYSAFLNINYMGKMADQAISNGREFVDSRWVMDLSAKYQMTALSELYVKADNITGEEYGVSYRPFGLRPGKAQSFFVGIKYAFFK